VKILVALTALFLLVAFCGCGSSAPSEKDLETAINTKVMAGKHYAKLVSFHKTNGVAQPPFYQVEYEGEIELTEDCYYGNGKNGGFIETVQSINSLPKDDPLRVVEENFMRDGFRIVRKKGERERIAGNFVCEKTEKGWR
jgi:hypothetical protein